MASQKILKARVQMKRDTSANWTSKNPVLLAGEQIAVETTEGLRFKVGDGTKTYTQLPFTDEIIRNLISVAEDSANDYTDEKIGNHNHDSRYYQKSEVDAKDKTISDNLSTHTSNKNNPHGVTASQLGLGNVNNTSDANKPVSTAQASAISEAAAGAVTDAGEYTDEQISSLSSTVDTKIGNVSSNLSTHTTNISNPHGVTKSQVGLGNVDNTSDMSKPVSTAQAKAIEDAIDAAVTEAVEESKSYTDTKKAFGRVTVGSTNIDADSTSDTLTLVAGANVTITPDATNDKVTISATDTVYTHPTTSGNKHIPSGGSSGQILRWASDGTAQWGADANTTYSQATADTLGLVKIGYNENGKNYPVELSNGQMFVNVPWTDTTYSSLKNPYSLTIKGNGTTLTNGTYDGSAAKTVDITPASIGAATTQSVTDAVDESKGYTDSAISKLLNNADTTAIDSIYELRDAMEDNADAISALNQVAAGKASSTHTHTVSHTPAGANEDTSITPTGTVTSTFTGTAASHNHGFTGTEATISTTYTPAGSVSQPTFTGTAATSGGPSKTTELYSITGVGTLPSVTYTAPSHSYTAPSMSASITNRCMSISFSAGTHTFSAGSHSFSAGSLPTRSAVTVASSDHTHSVTATGTVSKPTFSGTQATISTEYTPAGTVGSKSVTPAGTISSTFEGSPSSHSHTFKGTAATLTTSVPAN